MKLLVALSLLMPPISLPEIDSTYFIEENFRFEEVELVTNANKLTFMDYRMVTDTTSPQYRYRLEGNTGYLGIRKYKEYYQVAMGYKYAQIGDKFRVTFNTGEQIRVIVADSKGDRYAHEDGSQLEFIVNSDIIPSSAWLYGDFNQYFGDEIVKLERMRW